MLVLRSPREIEKMRRAGLVVWEAHQAAARLVRPGVSTREIDEAVDEVFARHQAQPLFKGYPGEIPFPAATCISVNEAVVHGIPGDRLLREGDIVSIDTGCRVDGWCGDAAVTHAVGQVSENAQRLLETTERALMLAIELLPTSQRWSEVAREMQRSVEEAGCSVIEKFVGHGIGREMHEAPQVPNFYEPSSDHDFPLKPGLVLAIEPMVSLGGKEVRCLADKWTQVTADASLAAHFEHTVALTKDGVRLLTGAPD
jgi:methionyl aminopeptidase